MHEQSAATVVAEDARSFAELAFVDHDIGDSETPLLPLAWSLAAFEEHRDGQGGSGLHDRETKHEAINRSRFYGGGERRSFRRADRRGMCSKQRNFFLVVALRDGLRLSEWLLCFRLHKKRNFPEAEALSASREETP